MRPCADPDGVIGGPDPPSGKSQVIWVSIEINTWTLDPPPHPLEKLDPLDPLKSIVFSVIKPVDPLCRGLKENKKQNVVQAIFWPSDYPPPPPTLTKIHRSAHGDYAFYQRSPAISRCAFIDVYVFCVPKNLLFDLWI